MYRILLFCMNINLVVAFSAFSLYKITEFLFDFQNFNAGVFVFFGTLFAYNYMRLSSFTQWSPHNINQNNYSNDKLIYLLLFLSSIAICYALFNLGFNFLKLMMPPIIITFLYPLIIKIHGNEYSLRKVPFLKIFLIAFVWGYVTLLAPLLYHDFNLDYVFFDSFFQRVLLILAISIPFDIRDYQYDTIKTIPNTLGLSESKFLAWSCLLMIDFLLIIDLINNVISFPYFLAIFISIELCSILIYYTHSNRSLIFYGVFIESLPIIMCLFVLAASFF